MNCVEYIILEAEGEWGTIAPEGTRLLVFLQEGQDEPSHGDVRAHFINEFIEEPEFAFTYMKVSEVQKSVQNLESQLARKKELLLKFPSAVEELKRESEELDRHFKKYEEDLKGFEKSLTKEQEKRERRYIESLNDDEEG